MSSTLEPDVPTKQRSPHWRDTLIVAALTYLAAILCPVRQHGDSYYSGLLMESLLDRHSFELEEYFEQPLDPGLHVLTPGGGLPYQVQKVGQHMHYYFPPGTSVLSLPFFAAFRMTGKTVFAASGSYSRSEEGRVLKRLGALVTAFFAATAFAIARRFMSRRRSAWFVAALMLGTQAWSTMSRGLWSHDWAVLLQALVCLKLLDAELGRRRLSGGVLGTLMTWGYMTRPTLAIPLIGVFLYMLVRHRQAALTYAVAVVGWMAIFVAYSWQHFHAVLPVSYSDLFPCC